ncbi:MAG: caspase family protein [Cyanobacteria bacterium J06639_14]
MSQPIRRRQLLQLAGGTLAAMGLDQRNWLRQVQRYDQALAQSTPRKLALLVGVNAYPNSMPSLRGCLTDVELQYHLLVHRYGFSPSDVLVVGDSTLALPGQTVVSPPTRQNILDAFETHLIGQAQPDDVVVFHYSGHGSFVQEADGVPEFNGLNGTLVPSDGRSQGSDRVDDIMGKTLFLLSLALATDNVTIVLDSCHAGGGTRGNLSIRALDTPNARPSEQELAYQAQWMDRLGLDPATLREKRQQGIAKGVSLGSTQLGLLAAEVPFDGFSAGAFTYLLTRYLWQLPTQQPLTDVFVNIARSTRDVANTTGLVQDPVYTTAQGTNWASRPVYLLEPVGVPAEAVLRDIQGNQVSFWLGGLSLDSLTARQVVYSLLDEQGNLVGEVQQTERIGLIGRGTLQNVTRQSLQPGQLMREQIRGVPTDLKLRVGLDASLGSESATALAGLNGLTRIEGIAITQATPVDYLLGRFTQTAQAQAQQRNIPIAAAPSSIGILTPDLTPIAATFGSTDESVQQAIARLRPRFKMLLAGKMLGTLTNSQVSDLQVEVGLFQNNDAMALLSLGSHSAQATGQTALMATNAVQVSAGTDLQIQVQNYESQDLFISLFSIADTGEIAILHPVVWDAPEESTRISKGATLRVPNPNDGNQFRLRVEGPAGFFELMALVSTAPLQEALRGLQTIARGRQSRSGDPLAFAEGTRSQDESEDAPVEVVDALLGDLDRGSRGGIGIVISPDAQQIDAQHLAAFSMVIEVLD